MVTLLWKQKPYMLRQLIADPAFSQQAAELTTALATVMADINAKLPYTCGHCQGKGLLSDGLTEDSSCSGYGYTETPVAIVNPQYTTSDQPDSLPFTG